MIHLTCCNQVGKIKKQGCGILLGMLPGVQNPENILPKCFYRSFLSDLNSHSVMEVDINIAWWS